jgi:hypothetical protein
MSQEVIDELIAMLRRLGAANMDIIDEAMTRLEILNAVQEHLVFLAEGSDESGSNVSPDRTIRIIWLTLSTHPI